MACTTVPVPLPAFVASAAAVSSDWRNWILDRSVFAAVIEVRGAGVGPAAGAVVVNEEPAVDGEVAGLEAKLSLAAEERAEGGREGGGDGVKSVLERLGGVLGLSFSHVGPSLEAVSMLALLGSRGGVGLRGGHLLTGASDLTNQSSFWFILKSAQARLIVLRSVLLCTAPVVKPPVHQVALD